MRIAVIGGRYRNETQLLRTARAMGHELEFEEGHTHGRHVDAIRTAVTRADLVVIVTDVNSHGGVQVAKRVARQVDRPTLIIQNFGVARLCRLLDAFEHRQRVNDTELPVMGARGVRGMAAIQQARPGEFVF